MKKVVFNILLMMVLMLGVSVSHAWAQSKALKGSWTFTITTPTTGPVPAGLTFKSKGKGTGILGPATLTIVYREGTSGDFSVSVEIPKEASITGAAFTALIRGRKTSDNAISGAFYVANDTSDPAAASLLLAGSVTGTRNK
jgi:hypothetical protein